MFPGYTAEFINIEHDLSGWVRALSVSQGGTRPPQSLQFYLHFLAAV